MIKFNRSGIVLVGDSFENELPDWLVANLATRRTFATEFGWGDMHYTCRPPAAKVECRKLRNTVPKVAETFEPDQ